LRNYASNPICFITGLSSLYRTQFPFGAANFFRNLQPQDYANNPIFNSRLASSTPDPDKHKLDSSAVSPQHPSQSIIQQEIPERDVSTVSSVPPSKNHVQNMAEMVEIYKQLEWKKAQQIQEAVAKEAIERINAMDVQATQQVGYGSNSVPSSNMLPNSNMLTGNIASVQMNSVTDDCRNKHFDEPQQTPIKNSGLQPSTASFPNTRDSGGFVGTESLGFTLGQADSHFKPIEPEGTIPPTNSLTHMDSSITAFQPYLSGDGQTFLPPQNWILNYNRTTDNIGHEDQVNRQAYQQLRTQREDVVHDKLEEPVSGRTEKSDATGNTEYVKLPRPVYDAQGTKSPSKTRDVVMKKHNGLYEIHLEDSRSSSKNDSCDKTGSSEATLNQSQGHNSLDVVPEKDKPQDKKCSKLAKSDESKSSTNGTFKLDGVKNDSQNISSMLSTPRTQNLSSTSGSGSIGGRIVFIPNDNKTPTVIGHVPGIPQSGTENQPISWPVTYPPTQGNSMLSGVSGVPGNSQLTGNSQVSAQNPAVVSQDAAGSGYFSHANAKAIAAGDIGVRKLCYLLKELKECNKVTSKYKTIVILNDCSVLCTVL